MKTHNEHQHRQSPHSAALVTALTVLGLAAATATTLAEPAPSRTPASTDAKGAARLAQASAAQWAAGQLPSEMEQAELGPLARAWNALPKTTNLVNTVREGKSLRVAVYQVGKPQPTGRVVVCLHGLLGDHTNWKYVSGALAGDYELWLVAFPGCGGSDSPHPRTLGVGGYGPTALADRVLQALAAQLAGRSNSVHLLLAGHSHGGMVALRMFADEDLRRRHARTLDAVEGLILFAPNDVVVTRATPAWLAVLGLNGFKAGVGDATGLLQKAVKDLARHSFCNPALVTRELVAHTVNNLRHGETRRGFQAKLREAIPWREFGKVLDWDAVRILEAGYNRVTPPCLIVWGECDDTLNSSMGYKIKDQLPNARLMILPRTKHTAALEHPSVCADLIRLFNQQLADNTLAPPHSVQTLSPLSATGLVFSGSR